MSPLVKYLFKDVSALVEFFGRRREWWKKAYHVTAGNVGEQALFAQSSGKSHRVVTQSDADEVAQAPDIGNSIWEPRSEFLQAFYPRSAIALDSFQQIFVLNDVEHRKCGGAGQGRPAKRRSVRARSETVGVGFGDPYGADREPSPQPLGHSDGIRPDTAVLKGEKCAGAPKPTLYFVQQKKEAMIVTELADAARQGKRARSIQSCVHTMPSTDAPLAP